MAEGKALSPVCSCVAAVAFVQKTVPTMKLEPVDKGYIIAQTIQNNRDLTRKEQQRLAESFKELKLSEPEQQEIMKRVATTTLKE